MSAKMTTDDSGSMAPLSQSFGKECSIETRVVKIVFEGGPISTDVHKNICDSVMQGTLFCESGDTGVLCLLLEKVEEAPVWRGTDRHPHGELLTDQAWFSAGKSHGHVCRDSAPGAMSVYGVEQDGMPMCVEVFRGGYKKDGSHRNVYMFRYHPELGHHNKIHPDHGVTSEDQLSNLRDRTKICGYQRILVQCGEEGCPYFCVWSSIDS